MVESKVHKWSLFCLIVKKRLRRSTWFPYMPFILFPNTQTNYTNYIAINSTILTFFPLSLVLGHYSALLLHLTALLLVLQKLLQNELLFCFVK